MILDELLFGLPYRLASLLISKPGFKRIIVRGYSSEYYTSYSYIIQIYYIYVLSIYKCKYALLKSYLTFTSKMQPLYLNSR